MIEIFGVIFTLIVGTLLHYTYEWSDRSLLLSFFAPTNESIFEHLKLLTTPFLLWTLNEYVHYGQFMKNFIPAKTIGLIAGIVFIILFFYGYTALLERNYLALDIASFAISVFIAFGLSHVLMELSVLGLFPVRLLIDGCLAALILSSIIFSVYPPRGPLFNSPALPRKK